MRLGLKMQAACKYLSEYKHNAWPSALVLYLFTVVWYYPVELHLTGMTSKPGKTRENNLTSGAGTQEYEHNGNWESAGPSPSHGLAIWCCALWDSGESCAFLFIVAPRHKPATSAGAQPLVNKGDFDKCNVCFTC